MVSIKFITELSRQQGFWTRDSNHRVPRDTVFAHKAAPESRSLIPYVPTTHTSTPRDTVSFVCLLFCFTKRENKRVGQIYLTVEEVALNFCFLAQHCNKFTAELGNIMIFCGMARYVFKT